MKNFTPIKNGLWTTRHRQRMGEAIWLFGTYLSFMGAHRGTLNLEKQEIYLIVYPAAVQRQLGISKGDWLTWHQLLEHQGYIESYLLQNQENTLAVCIKKVIL